MAESHHTAAVVASPVGKNFPEVITQVYENETPHVSANMPFGIFEPAG